MRRTGFGVAALLVVLALPGCGGGEEEAAAGSDELTLTLSEQGSSGQSGTATLTADGDSTRIVVELSAPPGPPQPSHVHSGTCDDIGAVVQPLENVEEGRAESVVPMGLDELRRGDLIVHAHKSEAEPKVSVACAVITEADSSRGYGY